MHDALILVSCVIMNFNICVFGQHFFINIGGALGVTVIVVGNGHANTSSKTWTRLIAFHIALIPLRNV